MKSSAAYLASLYCEKGDLRYDGEGVTQLAHAWQCGQLAKAQGASPQLQLSKKEGTPTTYGHDDRHEYVGGNYLLSVFSDEVSHPVLMHILAKRYLVTTNSNYHQSLSADSIRSLELQGGAMSENECSQFVSRPFAKDALSLRTWDDCAKNPDSKMPTKADAIAQLLNLAKECQ
jgi:predicted HD phosphohydrolase